MKNFPLRKGDETLSAIRALTRQLGTPPSQHELAAYLGITDWAAAKRLRQLELRGIVALDPIRVLKKRCTGCGEWLPETGEFFALERGKLAARCKTCKAAYDREYRQKAPQHHTARVETWRRKQTNYYRRKRIRAAWARIQSSLGRT